MKALVIGLGRVGYEYSRTRGLEASHFGALCMSEKIDTVIGVDKNEVRLKDVEEWVNSAEFQTKKLPSTKHFAFYSDYVEAIKKEHPEITIVATPTPSHYEIMKDIVHPDGPDVICLEKPLGSSLDEANRIANRQAYVWGLTRDLKPHPKVCVHFDRRWHPTWRKVKELLDEGEIGKPLVAIGHHPGPLLRSGIHMLDLFNWYFGTPDKARALSAKVSWMTKKYAETDDDAYNAEIRYNINGPLWQTTAMLLGADLGDVNYQVFELQIYGERGSISVYDNGVLLSMRGVEERQSYGMLRALDMDWTWNVEGDWVNRKYHQTMPLLVEDLVQAVENPEHQLANSLEDGVRAQMLVSMIRQSGMTSGQWMSPESVDQQETVKSI